MNKWREIPLSALPGRGLTAGTNRAGRDDKKERHMPLFFTISDVLPSVDAAGEMDAGFLHICLTQFTDLISSLLSGQIKKLLCLCSC